MKTPTSLVGNGAKQTQPAKVEMTFNPVGNPKAILVLAAITASVVTIVACSGNASGTSGTGGGTSCAQGYGGSWSFSGTCDESDCTVTQSGCNLSVSCSHGTKLSGSISGTSVSLGGSGSDGTTVSCSGTLSGKSLDASCTARATCTLAGACDTCSPTGASGSSGSSGSSGGPASYLCWTSNERCDCKPVSSIPDGATKVVNCVTTEDRGYCCQYPQRCGCDNTPGCPAANGKPVEVCENHY